MLPLRTRTQLCGAPLRVSTPPSHRSWLQCSGAVPSHPVAMSAGTAAIGDDAATPAPQTSHALARAAAFAMLMWRAALAKLTAIAASTNQMELDSDVSFFLPSCCSPDISLGTAGGKLWVADAAGCSSLRPPKPHTASV